MPTNIPYLDEVWQPVTGCWPCSPGCLNCYAAVQASHVRLRDHRRYTGLAVDGKWIGEVRCNEVDLGQPLKWRKRRVVGVCFMGDLAHPDVPNAFLDKVFAVMALCPQHTFVVCTKRAERMREYLTTPSRHNSIELAAEKVREGLPAFGGKHILPGLPLPNVHFGVTVESVPQMERIRHLRETPAAHRWISYEPGLGILTPGVESSKGISGLIVGCESGPNRRPFDLDWARHIIDWCAEFSVKCYVKQLDIDGRVVTDMAKFPEWARVRQLPWTAESEVRDA